MLKLARDSEDLNLQNVGGLIGEVATMILKLGQSEKTDLKNLSAASLFPAWWVSNPIYSPH